MANNKMREMETKQQHLNRRRRFREKSLIGRLLLKSSLHDIDVTCTDKGDRV